MIRNNIPVDRATCITTWAGNLRFNHNGVGQVLWFPAVVVSVKVTTDRPPSKWTRCLSAKLPIRDILEQRTPMYSWWVQESDTIKSSRRIFVKCVTRCESNFTCPVRHTEHYSVLWTSIVSIADLKYLSSKIDICQFENLPHILFVTRPPIYNSSESLGKDNIIQWML